MITHNQVSLNEQEFLAFKELIYNWTGIHLEHDKKYLIETRCSHILKDYQCASYQELFRKISQTQDQKLINEFVNAMTTRETLFFRDASPFQSLQHKVFPDFFDRITKNNLPKRLKIWSAACSSGQEAYSIAILLHELLPDISRWNIQIVGTDISDAAIKDASYGKYNAFAIQRGMSREYLDKYFVREDNLWKVKDEVRFLTTFKKMNLLEPDISFRGPFDIIFCRNVAIYFKMEDKKKLFQYIQKQLDPKGYLYVGSSESLMQIAPQFKTQRHMNSYYYTLQ